ncbi:MAG: hypothetical protein KC586_09150, partial [Myxococcales bacterium]|nr:hypothetical protein [Myxococcales bacterium]
FAVIALDAPPSLRRYVVALDAAAPRFRTLAPDPSLGDAEDHEAACLGWASRALDEHASVLAFAELLACLGEAGAPYACLATVQRLIADELRHVKLCLELASAFGDSRALGLDFTGPALPPRREPALSRALAIVVRELVVGEAESLIALRAYRDASFDPATLEAYAILLCDEARHASAGRHLEATLRATFPDDAFEPFLPHRDRVARDDARAMREAHRAGATNGPGRVYGVSIAPEAIPVFVEETLVVGRP